MMGTDRLKAFTDGVLAIVITIMVLELRAPHDAELTSLRPLVPVALSYVLSFVYLVIYWNNHHHLLHVTRRVTGGILWANAHLLFWLSLVPFATAWMGENRFAPVPTAAYGLVLLLAGIAYWVLERAIIVSQGPQSVLAAAIGGDMKGKLSLLAYAVAIPSAFVSPWIAGAIYVGGALLWLFPDRRIERIVAARGGGPSDAPVRAHGAARFVLARRSPASDAIERAGAAPPAERAELRAARRRPAGAAERRGTGSRPTGAPG